MTAATAASTPMNRPVQMRPIRIPADLRAVADLVELCFDATLDADGRRFVREMRRAGSNRGVYPGGRGMPPGVQGFVWVERGEVVGNINLIPVRIRRKTAYLIANVAVHPEHRRKGIARALTQAALDLANERRVRRTALQTDVINSAAQDLYRDFGFRETARRTTWHSGEVRPISLPPSITVRPRRRADWPGQRRWMEKLYNPQVRWNLSLNQSLYAPGIGGMLLRAGHQHQVRQWSAFHHREWIGSLVWQSSYNQADRFWLSGPTDRLALAACALIPSAQKELYDSKLVRQGRIMAVNFPQGLIVEAFEMIGFHEHNTLVWMEKDLGRE
jgi:ribosomal protein S18 acetylase RimI-like enzyme